MVACDLLPSKGQGQVTTATDMSNPGEDHQFPRTLKESAPSWLGRVGVSILLIAIPVAYIALVAMVAYLNNKEQSSFGDDVLEALQVASTLWPISFAAVAGPCLKTLALHRAEKGSSIESLEFLLTSQTTVAALKNLFTIRHIPAWSIGIALVWCLSPLGGQAAVRSLHLQPISSVTEVPALYYLGSNISDYNFFYNGTGGDTGVFVGASTMASFISDFRSAILTSFYMPDTLVSHANGSTDGFDSAIAALGGTLQAARLGQRDLWRNVRIPFLELLLGYNPDDPSSWVPVPSDMVVPYASFLGIPIRGGSFNRAGNSTLTVHAHYQTLSCKRIRNATDWLSDGSTKLVYHNQPSSDPPQHMYPGTGNGAHPNLFLDIVNNTGAREHLTNYLYPVVDLEPESKLQLVVAGMCYGDDANLGQPHWTFQICDISTSYVDIQVACTRFSPSESLTCQAVRVRHSPGFPTAGNLTAVSSRPTMNGIIWELPFATASHHPAEPSMLEMYLIDPTLVFRRMTPVTYNIRPACFANVSLDVFGARMATALNTAIMAMYNSSVLTGGDGISLKDRNRMWHNSTATWTEFIESRYVMQKAWFSVSLASTLVLLCLSLVNVVIRCIIKAPDFLDGVAGLTRDSQYIGVPQEGSGMSGSDRLQMIKGTKVRICDVNPDSDVGRIALTTNVDGPKLDWRRNYR
ncbi:hypothetical protein CDV31_008725 [Fusarium ambrosium]|uniref:Uncharacterized protein n=1 Tax=Fusarium ambrosium TaxID=131363 RepID=A0A428TYP4_9HYPO|nr:hypothetical protein CDV31_008725 [Fusarium ambrosium]